MADVLSQSGYDDFYAQGGWQYNRIRERWWHRRHMVRRFHLPRGARMLEVACGTGFHTDLFCRMGFDCVGLDSCATAVSIARGNFPGRDFHQCDARGALPFEDSSLEVIVTRGCSLYHYDLAGEGSLAATTNLLRYVKPGGRFILMIITDLSGRRDPNRVWQITLADYRSHFRRFDPNCTTNWHKGVAICSARRTG